MKDRTEAKYVIKLYEAQWDKLHDESVKPFFAQLKRELDEDESGHDALFSYYVFGTADSLSAALNYKLDTGLDSRLKIGYFGVHGQPDKLQALGSINRVKLRNILIKTTNFDGLYFGACDFANRKTAEMLLNNISTLKWVAGFSKWTPWLEGTICDIMFFRLLLSGRFRRPAHTNTKWDIIAKPEDAARNLYEVFPMASDLKFSLFYRGPNGIVSTIEEMADRIMAL
jgi:hypothetical protein